jgi:hypothetical protein
MSNADENNGKWIETTNKEVSLKLDALILEIHNGSKG